MERTKLDENDYGVDPFLSSITIASLCHHIFRSKIMKPETIGIIPENGYHPEHKTSIKLWLKFQPEKKNIPIQNRKNSGKIQVGKYRIDGCHHASNTYYRFHGCLFHGCQKCYKAETFNSFKQEINGDNF
ncbi:unnamed protein product [Brachionus calyciflorus]|uniref:Uncharacterized protein n=1 Tax=Brachionus calyciflorus TaxID=104777 RepID=A0A813WZX3_9BILA|nr:unnamed protein product [Brachionus calyciflorus]